MKDERRQGLTVALADAITSTRRMLVRVFVFIYWRWIGPGMFHPHKRARTHCTHCPQALENSLCEGNKYMRTHYGTGSFKQSYKAGSTGASDHYLRNHAVLNSELDKGRGGDGSGNSGASDSGDGDAAAGAPVGGSGGSSSSPAATAAATAIKVET